MVQLREEVNEEAMQSTYLAADLDSAQAELVRLEADLQSNRKAIKELISQRNQDRAQLEIALKEKAAELEEKYKADFDAAMEDEMRELTADYKAQLERVWD